MRAIVYHRYGLPDVLGLEDVAQPSINDEQALVRVRAASVNSWDWELLQGTPWPNRIGGVLSPRYPILGADVAGTVEAVGRRVTRFQPGDEVFGDLCRSGWGAFAEFTAAHETALAPKPAALTFEQAAAVPQAGCMALQGVRDDGHVQSGQRVLVNGAGGGVGTFAVQLAKMFGAEVTAVDSTAKLDLMLSIGADAVIDYTQEDFAKNGQRYDLIVDCTARRSVFTVRRSLAPRGTYVVIGGSGSPIFQTLLFGRLIRATAGQAMGLMLAKANHDIGYLSELLDSAKIAPVIDRTYPLREAPDAFRRIGEGRALGKLVITMTGAE